MIPASFPEPPLRVVVRLSDLLPEFRDSIEVARTNAGWDDVILQQAIRRSFDFLAPYTIARVERLSPDGGEADEFLVLDFSGAGVRDVPGTERAFAKATRQAERGDVKGALGELERIVREIPEVAKYHRALGQAYFVLNRPGEAEDELLRSLALDPRDPDALTLLGNLYARSGRPAKAVALYRRSIELMPNVYALTNTGAALAELGELDEAIASLRRAIDIDVKYPNAWWGLGLALSRKEDLSLLPEAIAALDKAIATAGTAPANSEIRDQARRLLMGLSQIDANEVWQRQGPATIDAAVAESLSRGDLPIRFEEGAPAGVLAKIEYGWVHNRPYHRVLTGGQDRPDRAHHVLHELEHLRLTSAARAAGQNRWFATTATETAAAHRALDADVARVIKGGMSGGEARKFATYGVQGLLGQLYNFPVDLLIEDRLLERYPRLRELIFQSVVGQLTTALKILNNRDIAAMTPRTIFRANAAMNGAFALWLEDRFPGRTQFAQEFGKADTASISRALYAQWKEASKAWRPGAELRWIDDWAGTLGLRSWYRWVDDTEDEEEGAGSVSDLVEP